MKTNKLKLKYCEQSLVYENAYYTGITITVHFRGESSFKNCNRKFQGLSIGTDLRIPVQKIVFDKMLRFYLISMLVISKITNVGQLF